MPIKFLLFIILMIAGTSLFAQELPGGLEGLVFDQATGRAVSDVKVTLEKGGRIIDSAQTNDSGYYKMSAIEPGSYKLRLFHVNYKKTVIAFIDIEEQAIVRRKDLLKPFPLKEARAILPF